LPRIGTLAALKLVNSDLRLVGSAKKADNNEYVFRSRYDAFLTPGYLLVGCGMVSYSKR
jgi:hypothetical protein